LIVRAGKLGNCDSYKGHVNRWELLPAFTDIPADWYPAYYEYRVVLQNVLIATLPIAEVCAQGGGTISDETDQAIISVLQDSKHRLMSLNDSLRTR
jgi:hypothetical protein